MIPFRARWLLLCICASCAAAPPSKPVASAARPPAFFDFAFLRDTPVAGTRLTACGRVTVTTTNTQRFELASFRKGPSPELATVAFGFDRLIEGFDLVVGHVDADHPVSSFNVGNPPQLSGALLQTADGKVTADRARGAEGGQGTLTWTDLSTQEVTFALGGPAGGGVVVDKFFVACRPQ